MKLINDLTRQDDALTRRILDAISNVVRGGYYVLGQEVRAFEEHFAAYCAAAHCVSVANGTDALEIALRALSIGAGARVATVANAGFYSTTAILAANATPVYVDIDGDTMTMSPASLEEVLNAVPINAVIVTHLYGRTADIEQISRLCRARRIPLIEDCAQAHGANIEGKRVGTWGDIGCFSFYPTKNLGAIGDGGALITQSGELAERMRMLRQYGWEKKYRNAIPGGRNSRLDELQAAILNVKLPYLDAWNERRRRIAQLYRALIANPRVALPPLGGSENVVHLYVIRVNERQSLIEHLRQHHIGCDIHYPIPDYQQPCIQHLYECFCLPETEKACESVLTLPCFPEMTDEDVAAVAAVVNSW